MKAFRSLVREVDQWRQTQQKTLRERLQHQFRELNRTTRLGKYAPQKLQTQQLRRYLALLQPTKLAAIALKPNPFRRKDTPPGTPNPVILVVAVVSLTSAIGHRFYNEPKLDVDTIAPQTLRAPATARVEDTETTEENRKAARTGSIPVLMIEQSVNQEVYQALQRLLDQGNELRQQAGTFPFIPSSSLSSGTQQYLRQAEEWEWRAVLAAVNQTDTSLPLPTRAASEPAPPSLSDRASASQQLAILELRAYRRSVSAEDFSTFKDATVRARQRYAEAIAALKTATISDPQTVYDISLLSLSDADWLATKTGIRQALERMLTQGIPAGMPTPLLAEAARLQVIEVPLSAQPIAVTILSSVLKPNLTQDPEQTRLRAEQAAQAVEPEYIAIRRGEVIVRAGEQITQADFVLLDYFGMSRREINWWGLLGFTVLMGGAVLLFLRVEQRFHPGLRRRDHVLVVLLTLTTPLVVALGLPTTSLPAIGLLVGSFYGSALGVTVVGLLSLVLPIGLEVGWSHLIASSVGSLVGALMAGRLRSREELALLGGFVGLTQGALYLLLSLIWNNPANLVWYGVLTAAALQGLMGIAWSIVALGISPYLEHLFDLVTPIRLAELSSPNRPLLKRLSAQAPGTFQHTLFVATLAEAAARTLGCNVELVRAGTLYHDIGKMHDALGFIENQMGGINKHDVMNDPWKSAEIIKKHVSEGLVMARKYRLPGAVQAFIPEHQGTMFIAYFHHQARQRAQADPSVVVNDQDFRYDGPIPQSRETGIVMLADSCEAALRSLKDATPEEALAMVNRILRARWQDQQLVDCGLTRPELSRIADVFVRVWQQFNHQRIPYPKLAASPQPAVK
jgi:cyclic-di-AMP phosphodiesterase PgpH